VIFNRTIKSNGSGLLAVVQRAGGAWRVLIADVSGRRPEVLSADEVVDVGLSSHLAAHEVGQVLAVVPADAVVCRMCALPNADPEQLQQALALQAEVLLPGNTPSHRVGMSVLPAHPGETNRIGMIVTWPESASFAPLDLAIPTTYAPNLAGLAALMNGLRPADAMLWLDRGTGAIGLALTHANGTTFRGTCETGETPEAWTRHVARVLFETGLSVGHNDAFLEGLAETLREQIEAASEEATLFMPSDLIDNAVGRLDGVRPDPAWWRTYGVAAGVLIARAGDLRGLTEMLGTPVLRAQSRVRAMAELLSKRDTALITVAICALLLGLVPMLTAGVRLKLLEWRYADIDQHVRAVDEANFKLAMYDELDDSAWPMTKLLSDIVSNTPVSIKLNSIRIQTGNRRFSVSGTVVDDQRGGRSSREVAAEMQSYLMDTGIFGEPSFSWGNKTSKGRDFDLSVPIELPFRAPRYDIDRDFEAWTYKDRKAGREPVGDDKITDEAGDETPTRVADGTAAERPETTTPIETASAAERDDGGATRRRRSAGGGSGDLANRSNTDERTPGSGPGGGAVPEPLSEAQINTMTKPELRSHLGVLAKAKNRYRNPQTDEEKAVKARLDSEWSLIMARMREVRE
jgi:hypothetical protein